MEIKGYFSKCPLIWISSYNDINSQRLSVAWINRTIIGVDNFVAYSAPTIFWTNDGILLIGLSQTNPVKFWSKYSNFHSRKLKRCLPNTFNGLDVSYRTPCTLSLVIFENCKEYNKVRNSVVMSRLSIIHLQSEAFVHPIYTLSIGCLIMNKWIHLIHHYGVMFYDCSCCILIEVFILHTIINICIGVWKTPLLTMK